MYNRSILFSSCGWLKRFKPNAAQPPMAGSLATCSPHASSCNLPWQQRLGQSSDLRRVKPEWNRQLSLNPCQVAVWVMKIGPRLGWEPYTKFLNASSYHGKYIAAVNATGTRNDQEQTRTEEPADCHHTAVLEHDGPLQDFQTSGAGWVPSHIVLSHPASNQKMKKITWRGILFVSGE